MEAFAVEALTGSRQSLRYFGSRQIKHRGTLGGNRHRLPIGDSAPVLMALNASLILASASGQRRVALDDFFVGYRQTAQRQGELITRIEIQRPEPGTRLGSYKVSRRREMDISAIALGAAITLSGDDTVQAARLVFGGMAATTQRAKGAEAALVGKPWSVDT